MHPFRQYIEQYNSLPPSDWERIAACLERREWKKGSILLEEGKICQHIYFVESGLLRYYRWKDGLDITKFFTIAPYCFTSQRSFNSRQPAQESIEALEDCVIWQMKRRDALALLEMLSWSEFVRKLVQEVQFFTEEILQELQSETAEDRYKKMLAQADPLLQRVPLKHLASYLGIAPQSLSRIRRSLQRK
ncbi:MAG: Crp/Fnr family transcriptional regulator [Bacteroidota bacterium]